jgi:hypothetical protein
VRGRKAGRRGGAAGMDELLRLIQLTDSYVAGNYDINKFV